MKSSLHFKVVMVGLLFSGGGLHNLTLGLLVLHASKTLAWHEDEISSKIRMMTRVMQKRPGFLERERRLTDTGGDDDEEDEAMLILELLSLYVVAQYIEKLEGTVNSYSQFMLPASSWSQISFLFF